MVEILKQEPEKSFEEHIRKEVSIEDIPMKETASGGAQEAR